jgi:hypothetical protein
MAHLTRSIPRRNIISRNTEAVTSLIAILLNLRRHISRGPKNLTDGIDQDPPDLASVSEGYFFLLVRFIRRHDGILLESPIGSHEVVLGHARFQQVGRIGQCRMSRDPAIRPEGDASREPRHPAGAMAKVGEERERVFEGSVVSLKIK